MKRLTAWDNGNAYYPKCFEEPCSGMGCNDERCEFKYEKCKHLAEYEDTGLTPEEINTLNTFDGSQAVKATMKLQDEQWKHRWIPVSERLPEDTVNPITRDAYVYPVTVDLGGVTDTRYYSFCRGHWYNRGPKEMDDLVIAWKERPEPYRP